MAKNILKFTKPYGIYVVGDVAGFSDAMAEKLRGVAVPYDKKKHDLKADVGGMDPRDLERQLQAIAEREVAVAMREAALSEPGAITPPPGGVVPVAVAAGDPVALTGAPVAYANTGKQATSKPPADTAAGKAAEGGPKAGDDAAKGETGAPPKTATK
jgi:hypothetical protein